MPVKYITLDLYRFIDIQTGKDKREIYDMQGISEWVFEWNMNNDWNYQVDVEVDDDDIDKAVSIIRKTTPVSSTYLLENYKSDIRDDIERAKREALRQNYESEWIKRYHSQLVDNIVTTIEEAGINTDKIYSYEGKEGIKSKRLMGDKLAWEHDTIAIPITRQQMKDILGYKTDYEPVGWGGSDEFQRWEWLADELIDNIDYKVVDTEHIDYHGSIWGGYEYWDDYFSDYSEIGYRIIESIKTQQTRLKAYITNKVPLSYR